MEDKLKSLDGRKILIVGADGLIGGALRQDLKNKKLDVWETTRKIQTIAKKRLYIDLSKNIAEWKPPNNVTVSYICAGSTLEYCRKFPRVSRKINVDNTFLLAKKLISHSSSVIFLSSSYVYDGAISFQKPDKPTSPRTLYARQKAAAEKQLLALGKGVTILRMTKVFSTRMKLFMNWIADLSNNKIIHPISDKMVSPIPLFFIIKVLHHLSQVHVPGIIQISGERDVSYADIAYQMAKRLKVSRKLVVPIESSALNIIDDTIASHETLDTSKVLLDNGLRPPSVWDTINWMIGENIKAVEGGYL